MTVDLKVLVKYFVECIFFNPEKMRMEKVLAVAWCAATVSGKQ